MFLWKYLCRSILIYDILLHKVCRSTLPYDILLHKVCKTKSTKILLHYVCRDMSIYFCKNYIVYLSCILHIEIYRSLSQEHETFFLTSAQKYDRISNNLRYISTWSMSRHRASSAEPLLASRGQHWCNANGFHLASIDRQLRHELPIHIFGVFSEFFFLNVRKYNCVYQIFLLNKKYVEVCQYTINFFMKYVIY